MKEKVASVLLMLLVVMGLQAKPTTESDSLKVNLLTQISDSAVSYEGLFKVHQLKKDLYFEIPAELIGRDLLIVNKILKVPYELNDAGINKGINYDNILIRFEVDEDDEQLYIRNVRPQPHYPKDDLIGHSIADNFISPLMGSLKIEAEGEDSSTYFVKVNDLFNGTLPIFNNLY